MALHRHLSWHLYSICLKFMKMAYSSRSRVSCPCRWRSDMLIAALHFELELVDRWFEFLPPHPGSCHLSSLYFRVLIFNLKIFWLLRFFSTWSSIWFSIDTLVCSSASTWPPSLSLSPSIELDPSSSSTSWVSTISTLGVGSPSTHWSWVLEIVLLECQAEPPLPQGDSHPPRGWLEEEFAVLQVLEFEEDFKG